MRRSGALLIGLCAALVLAGCAGRPPGVDGDLTNGWRAMPVAKTAVPVAGGCYRVRTTEIWYGDFNTVPCSGAHAVETVFVGAFGGSDAGRSSPPPQGGQSRVDAYAQCRKGTADYLGDDHHLGLFALYLVLPSDNAWTGGARWFRCDLMRFTDANETQTATTGSVKDGLRGNRPMQVTCKTLTEDAAGTDITDEQLADCAKPHNAELAGLFTAPNIPWPSDSKTRDNIASHGCEGVVAKYLGFTGGTPLNSHLGWEYPSFSQTLWTLGDRTIQCSVEGFKNGSSNGYRFVGSVKGIRSGTPKS